MNNYHYVTPLRVCAFALCFLSFLNPEHASAQAFDQPEHVFQVFIDHDADASGFDRVIFIDVQTGAQIESLIDGVRYTILPDALLYADRATDQLMMLMSSGVTRAHPFIQKPAGARRIDWLVSTDQTHIAWTITGGSPRTLTTQTFIADIDGENIRDLLTDGPRDAIRAFPVAFSVDHTRLYMDYQPDAIGDFAPLRQFAGLFAVDTATGAITELQGEPGCFCGAAFGAGQFMRLTLAGGLDGFGVRLIDVRSNSERTISSLNLVNFTQGGDVLIAPDGRSAVYTLAQIRGFGTPGQTVQSVFILVDIDLGTQRVLTQPANTLFRPVGWSDDARALIVSSATLDGTWKIDLDDGDLRLIAEPSFLGTITSSSL